MAILSINPQIKFKKNFPLSLWLGAVFVGVVSNNYIISTGILTCNAKRKYCTFVIVMSGLNIYCLCLLRYNPNYPWTIHSSGNRLWSCDTMQDLLTYLIRWLGPRRAVPATLLSVVPLLKLISKAVWSCLHGSRSVRWNNTVGYLITWASDSVFALHLKSFVD